ncbi:hypothetical protein Taro_041804 [Colocasia esculenta]|uniref:Uncharacterized protein n=1 Tax=Colocasia esculenta TaxID=4460 RepID=A0A843WWV9_COLES|nr:hypothetical protein [Colocasia esculenta]
MLEVFCWLFGHYGPRIRAQGAHWFSVCERERAGRRVLNATVQGVAFTLPPFGVVWLHACRMACTGQPAGVSNEKATEEAAKQSRKLCSTRERVAAAITSDVDLEASVLTWFWRIEAARSACTCNWCGLLTVVVRRIPAFSGVEVNLCYVKVLWCDLPLVVFTLLKIACEAYSRGRGLPVRLVAKVVVCCGVVTDLYHQQLSSSRVQCELCSLGVCPRHGHAVVRGLQVWCWLDSTVLWLYCVVVERQLDLSSVTAKLRGTYNRCGLLTVVVRRVLAFSGVEVFVRVVRLGGPPGWAQSAHRFFACERDRGVRRVLNATALGVAFLLPLFGGHRLHGCRVSLAGQSADVGLSFHRLCSTRGSCCGFLGDSRFWRCVRRVLAARTSRGVGETPEVRILHEGGASALVTLTKRVAHEVGMFYVVNVLSGLRVHGYETERLFLCCVVRVGYWPDQPVVLVIVVSEQRLTGCGLLCVECPPLAHVMRFRCSGVPYVTLLWLCFVVVLRGGRLGESSSKKKHSNALKATNGSSEGESESERSDEGSEDEEAFLSRRLQCILAKKKY